MLDSQEQLLDPDFRKAMLEEINGQENISRRHYQLRKHEIYRDKTKKWVLVALEQEQMKPETLAAMANRATNVSICRRIINKLARSYIVPPKRTVTTGQEAIDEWSDELDFNTNMKKADRYRQLFYNALLLVVPIKDSRQSAMAENDIFRLSVKVLPPWAYDVIPDKNDPTKVGALILSEFTKRNEHTYAEGHGGPGGYHSSPIAPRLEQGDGKEQVIADSPSDKYADEKNQRYIWWSDSYHFTTDSKGEILPDESPEQNENPIGILPSINFCGEQDNDFWSEGGDDVPDTSVLLNKIMTDINFISYVQGWGQMVITGKDLPKNIEGGPGKAFVLNQESVDDPTPNVYFASSSPPIGEWLETLKTTLAMLLSTNGLSVRNISAKLDVSDLPSGVAMMVENSEVVEFNQDTQMQFQDKEPLIWELVQKWAELYKNTDQLVIEQKALPEITDTNVSTQFMDVKPPVTDSEMLDAAKKKKDLGIVTLKDLLKIENPDLTEEQAEARLEEIKKEKAENQAMFAPAVGRISDSSNSEVEGEETEDDESEETD